MTINLLLVDDTRALREWLSRALIQAGYLVTQASSGEEALALLLQAGGNRIPFDVVITDIVMGAVDGIQVVSAARSQPDPPEVILITSHGTVDTAMAALRLGAFDYLMRPIQTPALLERVRAAVARRAEQRQQAEEAAAWRSVAEAFNQIQLGAKPPDATTTAKPERYYTLGQLWIDTHRHEVRFAGQPLAVTPIEYMILVCLAETPAMVVTYGVLVQHTHAITLSEREAYNLLRTHIRNLRRKIDPSYLISVRGVGYILDTPA